VAPEILPDVSVVVPARNAARTLADCLRSLVEMDYPPSRREILVVDNGSTDGSPAIIEQFPVTALRESRRGPSHARNRGILASGGGIIAFTDADCIVTSRWLRSLISGFDEDEVWAVAGEVLAYPPRTWAESYMARRRPCWQRAALHSGRPYVVTANVAFRRQTFDRIGLFDPRFVTGQDKDFSWRFLGAGLALRHAPAAVVYHRHRPGPWGFFVQQLRWARGAVLLRRYHGLPWGLGAEIEEYRQLLRVAAALAAAAGQAPFGPGGKPEFYYQLYDLLREVARRAAAPSLAFTGLGRPLSAWRNRPRQLAGSADREIRGSSNVLAGRDRRG
jgi:glycosyltransferase involved in cell wall biosynthesis